MPSVENAFEVDLIGRLARSVGVACPMMDGSFR